MRHEIVNGKKYIFMEHKVTWETGSCCKHCIADLDENLCVQLQQRDCVGGYFQKEENIMQVGGTHYEQMAIQPLQVMKANFSKAEYEGYLRGNVLKYLLRYQTKNGVEDLKKASSYLDELVGYLEV